MEANALLSISIDELTAENKEALKTLVKDIETLLKDAHKALMDSVKALKEAMRIKMEARGNTTTEASAKTE